MKKFITAISMQVTGQLGKYRYQAVGNGRLDMEEPTSFPIVTAINGYVEPGEQCQVIAVVVDTETGRANLAVLEEELKALAQRKSIPMPQVVTIAIPEDEAVAVHAETFRRIAILLDHDDELFACLTFGTKPLSEAIRMAVQYGYRVRRNASITCVVYGQIIRQGPDRSQWYGLVHDETALLRLDEIVRLLAERKVEHPDEILDTLLAL